MQIQFPVIKPFSQYNVNMFGMNNYQQRISLENKPDVFIKSSNNVAFTGNNDKIGVKDVLVTAGFVGVPVLLGIGVTSALAGNQSAEDIFLPDGTYFASASELAGTQIHANAETGELSIPGTPINIDPSKIQYADADKGVYKSEDGNIDIDLLNNKYIDKENGIFIDPSRNISAMKIDGELHSVAIPNFGSGYPTTPWDPTWAQHKPLPPAIHRSDFEEKYDMTPEEYQALYGHLPQKVLPDDDRSVIEKISDYVTGKHDNNTYDIFGNQIVSYHGSDGTLHHVSIDEHLKEALEAKNLDTETLSKVADFVNDSNLQKYITETAPEYASLVHVDSMESFISKLSKHDTDTDTDTDATNIDKGDVDDVDDVDVDDDTTSTLSDFFSHFLETLADEV